MVRTGGWTGVQSVAEEEGVGKIGDWVLVLALHWSLRRLREGKK